MSIIMSSIEALGADYCFYDEVPIVLLLYYSFIHNEILL